MGILALTVAIFWYLFKDIPIEKVKEALQTFDYSWVLLSIGLSFISHFLRAWRWTLLLNGSNHNVGPLNSYFAVMVGYLVNSLFPRLGEVTRCGIINRTNKVPVGFSIGTVVTERAIDMLMLLLLTVVTFFLQFDLLSDYLSNAEGSVVAFLKSKWWLLTGIFLIGIFGLYILFYSEVGNRVKLVAKIKSFVKEVMTGMLSIKNVKNQSGFWLSTIGIWILYFLMLYVITFGSDTTRDLGILAGMSILVMGSFGMAAPTPNGFAAFHALVAGVLGLYGIAEDEGLIFATIMHTSQFVTVLIFGSISLILVNVMYKPSKVGRDKAKDQVLESAK